MDKDYLKKRVKDFNVYVNSNITNQQVYEAYQKFFNWLLNQTDELETDEDKTLLIAIIYDLAYSSIKWAENKMIIFKDYSTNWNSKLIRQVGEFVNQFNAIRKESQLKAYPMDKYRMKYAVIINKMMQERDYATFAYCCQMIQNSGFVNFRKLSDSIKHPHQNENEEFDQPFGKIGNYSKLQFLSKDEKALNELVTIPQAIEMGLNLHLLQWTADTGHQQCYLNGFELERMGFEKPTEDHTPIWEVYESTLTETEKENLKELDEAINEIMAPVTNID